MTYRKLFSIGVEIIPANAYLEYFYCAERMTLAIRRSILKLLVNILNKISLLQLTIIICYILN
jgi:hypothetical protein